MVNALFRKTSLTLGPIILETLLKHYFDRFSKVHETENMTRLRKEELLYDEAFNIIKVRLRRFSTFAFRICSHGGHTPAPRAYVVRATLSRPTK